MVSPALTNVKYADTFMRSYERPTEHVNRLRSDTRKIATNRRHQSRRLDFPQLKKNEPRPSNNQTANCHPRSVTNYPQQASILVLPTQDQNTTHKKQPPAKKTYPSVCKIG